MSGVKRRRDFTSNQHDLFQQLDQPAEVASDADLDINLELLGAINTAIREAKARGLSRERIVDRMNRHLGGTVITLRQLNAWTAVSQEYKEFPARYLPAFCAATDCDLPIRVLAQSVGRELVDHREAVAKRLGDSIVESARLAREQRELKRTLGERTP